MRPYHVTIVKDGIRYSFNAVAKSWYQAWCMAADEFGIASHVTVKPV